MTQAQTPKDPARQGDVGRFLAQAREDQVLISLLRQRTFALSEENAQLHQLLEQLNARTSEDQEAGHAAGDQDPADRDADGASEAAGRDADGTS